MKVKKTAKILIFCVIFLFMLNRIYEVFAWKDTSGEYSSSMNSFYALEDNVVDVLFLGSSHCYCSINPSQLWETYGMACFSMAISGQDLASSYYCLEEALKTQDIKVACIDMYGCTFHGYESEGNVYRNLLSRKLSFTYVEAVESMVETENTADYILKWPIIHTRYRELKKEDFQTQRPTYLGYLSEFKVTPISPIVFMDAEPREFGEEEQDWVIKMIELAQENEVELVFFLAPYQIYGGSQANIAYAKEMVEKYNIPFVDMVELSAEVGLDWNQDFIDDNHTNYYGATKVTSYLGEFLHKNYDLEDHRGDVRYALWEEDLKTRQHEVQNHQLLQVVDPNTYLSTIGTLEDYTVVVSTTGAYISGEKMIDEYLQEIGIFEEFYEGSGVWVFDDRQCIYVSMEADMLQTIDLSYSDLVVGSSAGVKSVVVDRVAYQKVENGINILVYDNLLGDVVDSVGFDAMYAYGMIR